MNSPYEDIIHLPHHVSRKHPQMSMRDRAAQFSPFAALSGYEEAIAETARQTESRPELNDEQCAELNRRLAFLSSCLADEPEVRITYFVQDERKPGGKCETIAGRVKEYSDRKLVMRDGAAIPIADIVNLDGRVFETWECPILRIWREADLS